jgi:hypothetical protein
VAGFEPAASCSQSRRDNRATLHPETIFKQVEFEPAVFLTYKLERDNRTTLNIEKKAESKGFEPLVQFPIRMFSKHVLSATQATLQLKEVRLLLSGCKGKFLFCILQIIKLFF